METIKISLEVNVNFSEATMAFLKNLFCQQKCSTSIEQKEKLEEVQAPAHDAQPATNNNTEAQAKPSTINIDLVRKALGEKVNDHRAEIKAKLEELDAPSVTKLDSSKYEEMYNFLIAL